MLSSSTFYFSSTIPLDKFPAELLLEIFKELDIPTLLKVCNVCKRFQQIGSKALSKKFMEPGVGINLTFDQEHKWRFDVQFECTKFSERTGKFIFKPRSKQPMRFIYSPMTRNPSLSKISIRTPSTTTGESRNHLQKSLPLNIKSNRETINMVHHAYRIGHGSTHLRIPYKFKYSITDTPPPSMQNTRGGERWLSPISFECTPSFFYPHEPTAHKIIMTIIQLRKKNLHKKKSRQNQSIIDFEEVEEDYVSIELMNAQDNLRNRRLFERHMNQQEYFFSSSTRKHKWGARG